MKKLLLLSTLIAIMPFIANATGPTSIDPEDAVYADDAGPYETAELLPGDTTNVVSASYVKGAYNDAITAINTLKSDKQEKIANMNGQEMSDTTFSSSIFVENLDGGIDSEIFFVSAAATAAGIKSQRVTAVDTWGSTHTVDLGLKTVTQ